jgi:hypothetical protein
MANKYVWKYVFTVNIPNLSVLEFITVKPLHFSIMTIMTPIGWQPYGSNPIDGIDRIDYELNIEAALMR